MLAGVGGEDALTQAEPSLVAGVLPLGLAREADGAVAARLRARIARGNERDGFPAVLGASLPQRRGGNGEVINPKCP